MVYFLRRIKDVQLLFAPKRRQIKIFEHQGVLQRKTSFCIQLRFLYKKKVQFVIVDFQTQFIDNKRKLRRENQWNPITLKKVVSFTRNYSIHWKLFRIVETIHFNGSHFIYWKLCFLVEFITFKGSCCPQWKQEYQKAKLFNILGGSCSFQAKPFFQWKLSVLLEMFLLVEAIPFDGPGSF